MTPRPFTLCLLFGWLVPGCGLVFDVPDYQRANHTRDDELACDPGFGDCNGDIDDGCEADLRTDAHCGACANDCGGGACTAGACVCGASFADCDGDATNGCETHLEYDPRHCGACARDCSPGGCLAGHCLPAELVSESNFPSPFSVVGDDLYYLVGGQAVARARIDASSGDQKPIVIIQPNIAVSFLAVGGGRLFWSQGSLVTGGQKQALFTSALDGSDRATLGSDTFYPGENPVVIDQNNAFWIRYDSPSFVTLRGAPVAGGPIVDEQSAAMTAGQIPTLALTIDNVFWTTTSNTLHRHAVAGGANTEIALPNVIQGGPVAAAQGLVCVAGTAPSSDSYYTTYLDCGAETDSTLSVRATIELTMMSSLAIGDTETIFAADSSRAEIRVSRGATTSTVAATEGYAENLLVVAGDLYWATGSGVYRLRHPLD